MADDDWRPREETEGDELPNYSKFLISIVLSYFDWVLGVLLWFRLRFSIGVLVLEIRVSNLGILFWGLIGVVEA